jgi:hypothetical protein
MSGTEAEKKERRRLAKIEAMRRYRQTEKYREYLERHRIRNAEKARAKYNEKKKALGKMGGYERFRNGKD